MSNWTKFGDKLPEIGQLFITSENESWIFGTGFPYRDDDYWQAVYTKEQVIDILESYTEPDADVEVREYMSRFIDNFIQDTK